MLFGPEMCPAPTTTITCLPAAISSAILSAMAGLRSSSRRSMIFLEPAFCSDSSRNNVTTLETRDRLAQHGIAFVVGQATKYFCLKLHTFQFHDLLFILLSACDEMDINAECWLIPAFGKGTDH